MNGLGQILKSEREKKNIPLGEISKKTNISERILMALENNDFRYIPGKFYLNSFLKSYLKALDIDEETFFINHKESIERVIQQNRETFPVYYNKIRYSRFKRKKIFLGITILILASVFLTYLAVENKEYIFNILHSSSKSKSVPETGIIHNLENEAIKPDFSPVSVVIESISDCWIQVFRGNRKYTEKILKQGETERINGYELLIIIGNPSSINLAINGKKIFNYKNQSKPLKLYLNPENIHTF